MDLFHRLKNLKTRLTDSTRGDNCLYWRARALNSQWSPVLWRNEEYNSLFRNQEKKAITPSLRELPLGGRILDMGCGTGEMTSWMAEIRPDAIVHGVDFPEMIDLARRLNPRTTIAYFAIPGEEYCLKDGYDLIVSSATISMIAEPGKRARTLENCAEMARQRSGTIVMLDPFHRWPFLARAVCGAWDVKQSMKLHGLRCVRHSGMLFWPFRELLANSNVKGRFLEVAFSSGEVLLALLGRRLWSDYKLLVFQSPGSVLRVPD